MKNVRLYVFLFSLLFLSGLTTYAQVKGTKSKTTKTTTKKPAVKPAPAKTTVKQPTKSAPIKTDDPLKNEQQVRDIIAFLEYVLNTIGSATTAASDKDVLITESYTKIFRDAKVQIEDDLAEKRDVITNKDVPAYLKDVDFFFKDIKFEFAIENIQSGTNANNKLFYKVSTRRNLKGIDVEGKAVNSTVPRFIEINYDPKDQDLKIVSIYTHEIDETAALNSWWKQLSYEWQSVFQKKLNLADSVQLSDIKNIVSLEELDLSGNTYIRDLEPLSRLSSLRILNISNTSLTDLSQIRNLTELEELTISNTSISDISSLRYSDKLKKLAMNHTLVSDISVFEKLASMNHLEMVATPVTDITPVSSMIDLHNLDVKDSKIASLAPIESLTNVTDLSISGTPITDLNPIKGYKNLAVLYIDSTRVADLIALSGLTGLKELHMNYTTLSNLQPLKDLPHLERIYCDHSQITRTIADTFMGANPEVLVILDSEDLKNWWAALPDSWHGVFSKAAKITSNPTKEELARVTNL
ncbi:MAG TPA: leucine-rich repeat domain-containing protein, partial [Cyclobacteriaceae bacterium]